MRHAARRRRAGASAPGRAGLTLLEVSIALVIFSLLVVNVSMVSRTGSRVAATGVFVTALNDEADMTLDRITLALMSAKSDDLYPQAAAPASSSYVGYSVSLGLENGEIVYAAPERIDWSALGPTGRITWYQNYSAPEERSVVWSSSVPSLRDGEIANGLDDNGNQIQDESGLAFVKDGSLMTVLLTVEREDPDGNPLATSRQKLVTCRN